jgi:EAL domain-containing protein (putative c-di-GMP-specific phosphodiesterase class I)
MRADVPTSGDLFIPRRRRLTRSRSGHGGPPGAVPVSGRQARHEWARAERLVEERDRLIRATIANRALETHFQPIVDLQAGQAIGTEALSRFPDGPVRPPDEWFATAASVGLGVDLELVALELALDQLPHLPSNLYLSLNASVEAIQSEGFRDLVSDLPAERIVLELTEHTPVTDYEAFADSVRGIRSLGMRLAVDDAGSGFSSFSHILNLKPDIVKLDIALTRGIDRDPARQALGRALLAFGLESYRMTIVAEGIETRGELETLRSLGCPSGQGFILGRPGRLAPRGLTPLSMPTGPVPAARGAH